MELAPHIREAFEKQGVVIDKVDHRGNKIDIEGRLIGITPAEWTLSCHDGPSCYGFLISSCTENAGETWEPIQADLMAGPKNHCSHVSAWSAWVYKRSQEPIDLRGADPKAVQAVIDALRAGLKTG